MGVSVFPILIAPFPVLLQPVSNEFGWGRSTLSLAILLATAIATLLYPFVGRALDRWGSRAILVPGFLMFGLSICALSLIGRHEPQLYLLYILAGACGTLPTGVAFGRVHHSGVRFQPRARPGNLSWGGRRGWRRDHARVCALADCDVRLARCIHRTRARPARNRISRCPPVDPRATRREAKW